MIIMLTMKVPIMHIINVASMRDGDMTAASAMRVTMIAVNFMSSHRQ